MDISIELFEISCLCIARVVRVDGIVNTSSQYLLDQETFSKPKIQKPNEGVATLRTNLGALT